jgi:hypothetical protein
MGDVYAKIAERLKTSCSIDIGEYIDFALGRTAGLQQGYKEGKTTLDGIEFISRTNSKSVSAQHLKDAFHLAHAGGKRLFAGQLRPEDLENGPLQASFGATDGLGFREIYYPEYSAAPYQDHGLGRFPDEEMRSFSARFGPMIDAGNIESLHADLAPTGTRWSKIHIDMEGFVYADRAGRIFLSANAIQHTGDELGIRDKLLGSTSPLSFFFHTDLNSISDPARAYFDTRGNRFTERQNPRGTLGLELSTEHSGIQYFARGSMGLEAKGLRKPEISDWSGTIGIRFRFGKRGR